eukprot:7445163-Pyramimonas_sp.AAC.1
MYFQVALSRGISRQFMQKACSRAGFPRNCSDAAPSTLRNHALVVHSFTIYVGIALSLEISSRFMQDARFSNLPA